MFDRHFLLAAFVLADLIFGSAQNRGDLRLGHVVIDTQIPDLLRLYPPNIVSTQGIAPVKVFFKHFNRIYGIVTVHHKSRSDIYE